MSLKRGARSVYLFQISSQRLIDISPHTRSNVYLALSLSTRKIQVVTTPQFSKQSVNTQSNRRFDTSGILRRIVAGVSFFLQDFPAQCRGPISFSGPEQIDQTARGGCRQAATRYEAQDGLHRDHCRLSIPEA